MAETCTCGGTMSGNCATGMRLSPTSPARVMTIAITIASLGRSMNTPEIMPWLLGGGGLGASCEVCRGVMGEAARVA